MSRRAGLLCGLVRALSHDDPGLEEISNERRDVKVCKLNVDHALKLAAAYGISSIPTIVVIKDGRITDKSIGVTPKEVVLAMVDA